MTFQPPLDSTPGMACPNCGAASAGSGKYCPDCGQRNDRLRLTARALVKDLAQALFKVDTKLPSTVKGLVVPGSLTLDYLRGRRAGQVRPFTLYLVCATLHFLAYSHTRRDDNAFSMGLAQGRIELDARDGGVSDGGVEPPQDASKVATKLKEHPELVKEFTTAVNTPKGQLPWVVAFALALMLGVRKRRFYYSEQLTFALHVQAFGSLLGAAGMVSHLPDWVAATLSGLYDLVAFGRVYGFGVWGSLWRFAVVSFLAAILFSLGSVAALFLYAELS